MSDDESTQVGGENDSGSGIGLGDAPSASPAKGDAKTPSKNKTADAEEEPASAKKSKVSVEKEVKEIVAAATMERDAYSKLLLHACKHPARPVLGVLLGRKGKTDEKDALAHVVEAVPLFHSYVLAPMLEMSMMQVRMSPCGIQRSHLFSLC